MAQKSQMESEPSEPSETEEKDDANDDSDEESTGHRRDADEGSSKAHLPAEDLKEEHSEEQESKDNSG